MRIKQLVHSIPISKNAKLIQQPPLQPVTDVKPGNTLRNTRRILSPIVRIKFRMDNFLRPLFGFFTMDKRSTFA